MAFVNGARAYLEAAVRLTPEGTSADHVSLNLDPVYFLYLHAAELALKGYVRGHGRIAPNRRHSGHQLAALLTDCEDLGLGKNADVRRARHNVVYLLGHANKNQGLRYFTLESQNYPSLAWTRKVIGGLVREVSTTLAKLDPSPGKLPAAKVNLIVGEPGER